MKSFCKRHLHFQQRGPFPAHLLLLLNLLIMCFGTCLCVCWIVPPDEITGPLAGSCFQALGVLHSPEQGGASALTALYKPSHRFLPSTAPSLTGHWRSAFQPRGHRLSLQRTGWTEHTHHHARRQGWPLPVVVAMGELQVEEQSAVRCRVQAVRVHQHLQAEAAVPVKSGWVHHA